MIDTEPMPLKILLTFLLTCLLPLSAHAEEAAKEQKELKIVQATTQPIFADIGAKKIGVAFLNALVEVNEKKGKWSHVTFTGWVRRNVVGGKFVKGPGGKKIRKLFIQTENQVMWSEPSGKRFASPARGLEIKLNSDAGGWVNVTFDGWVHSGTLGDDFVEPAAAKDPITIESFVLKHLPDGDNNGPARVVLDLSIKNNTRYPIDIWRAILVVRDTLGENIVTNRVSHKDGNIEPGKVVTASYYWASGDIPYTKLLRRKTKDLKVELLKIELQ